MTVEACSLHGCSTQLVAELTVLSGSSSTLVVASEAAGIAETWAAFGDTGRTATFSDIVWSIHPLRFDGSDGLQCPTSEDLELRARTTDIIGGILNAGAVFSHVEAALAHYDGILPLDRARTLFMLLGDYVSTADLLASELEFIINVMVITNDAIERDLSCLNVTLEEREELSDLAMTVLDVWRTRIWSDMVCMENARTFEVGCEACVDGVSFARLAPGDAAFSNRVQLDLAFGLASVITDGCVTVSVMEVTLTVDLSTPYLSPTDGRFISLSTGTSTSMAFVDGGVPGSYMARFPFPGLQSAVQSGLSPLCLSGSDESQLVAATAMVDGSDLVCSTEDAVVGVVLVCPSGFVELNDTAGNLIGCELSCLAHTDCTSGQYCDFPSADCLPLLANNEACTDSYQCFSEVCSGGLCSVDSNSVSSDLADIESAVGGAAANVQSGVGIGLAFLVIVLVWRRKKQQDRMRKTEVIDPELQENEARVTNVMSVVKKLADGEEEEEVGVGRLVVERDESERARHSNHKRLLTGVASVGVLVPGSDEPISTRTAAAQGHTVTAHVRDALGYVGDGERPSTPLSALSTEGTNWAAAPRVTRGGSKANTSLANTGGSSLASTTVPAAVTSAVARNFDGNEWRHDSSEVNIFGDGRDVLKPQIDNLQAVRPPMSTLTFEDGGGIKLSDLVDNLDRGSPASSLAFTGGAVSAGTSGRRGMSNRDSGISKKYDLLSLEASDATTDRWRTLADSSGHLSDGADLASPLSAMSPQLAAPEAEILSDVSIASLDGLRESLSAIKVNLEDVGGGRDRRRKSSRAVRRGVR